MKRNIFSPLSLLTVSSLTAISLLSPISILSGKAYAQFDQSFSVEGKYIPEVIRLDRINAFPRQEKFTLESVPLSYDATGAVASFAPKLYSLEAMGWKDTRKIYDNRGYLDFGMGSWLNSTLSAGYRFVQDEKTTVGVRFQHNSTSLWKPSSLSDIRQYRYDEALGVYGSHRFAGYGRLEAAVDYHIGNFNYYGYNPHSEGISLLNKDTKAPTQTLNDVAARIGWQSESGVDDLSWNLAAGVRYFGYRRLYDAETDIYSPGFQLKEFKSTRETDINITGGILFPTSTKSAIGLDLKTDVLTYSGYKADSDPDAVGFLNDRPDTYGLVTLTPFYRFFINRLNLRLGVDVDIAAKAGTADDQYDLFHFAPDVLLDYDGGPARLFLHLQGGSTLHTLAAGSELDYYQQPFMINTTPVYTPLDGEFGATFGPFSGFSAGVGFAFRVSRGVYTGGWYQSWLNHSLFASGDNIPAGLPATYEGMDATYVLAESGTYDLSGFSIKANLDYDLGKAFKISANGAYQPQNGTKGYFNGFDRPRWTARIAAQTNPWKSLKFSLAYTYRGVRNAYAYGMIHNNKGFDEAFLASKRLEDITSLDFGASYSFTDAFSIWLQADNLLNRHIELLPGLRSQGITAALGLSLLF